MNTHILTEVAAELLRHTNPNAFMDRFVIANAKEHKEMITFWLLIESQLHDHLESNELFCLNIAASTYENHIQTLQQQYQSLCGHIEKPLAVKAAGIAARCNIKARAVLEEMSSN